MLKASFKERFIKDDMHHQSCLSLIKSAPTSASGATSAPLSNPTPAATVIFIMYQSCIVTRTDKTSERTYKHPVILCLLKPIFHSLLALLCVIFSITSWATDFQGCPQNFHGQLAPDYIDANLMKDTLPLCFDGFATLYSGVSRTPLWSAEHLTRERLYQAEEILREDSFHSESRLPERMRAYLSDYRGSGYDRGHLAPNADMANASQQYDSFSLANIIPQTSENNRYVWQNLESVTRYFTKKYGEVYVVTGVAFRGDKLSQLNNRVLVPSHIFKALYIPQTGEASAYYAPNDDTKRVELISLDELALRSGIDAFPSISSEAKATQIPFPTMVDEIGAYSNSKDNSSQASDGSQSDDPLWYLILIEILRWLVDNFMTK